MSTVLIIEDDPLVSRMYQTVFEFEGFSVEMARNGEEGIEKLKKSKPKMILLDVMMPKMSGIEVLQEIKSNPQTKSIPVVVLTNLSGDKDAEKALELGAVKFIVKSKNRPKQIVAQIREILAGYTREEIPEAARN
jgi:CheY-like chemotaxis protein